MLDGGDSSCLRNTTGLLNLGHLFGDGVTNMTQWKGIKVMTNQASDEVDLGDFPATRNEVLSAWFDDAYVNAINGRWITEEDMNAFWNSIEELKND